jgi:hypothetical protein
MEPRWLTGVVAGRRVRRPRTCASITAGATDFSHLRHALTHVGAQPAFYSLHTEISFPGSNLAKHETSHSSPSNAEVKIRGGVPPLIHITLRAGA